MRRNTKERLKEIKKHIKTIYVGGEASRRR